MPGEGEGDSSRCGIVSFSVRAELDKEVYAFEPGSPGFSLPGQAPLGGILTIAHLLLLQVPGPGWPQGTGTGMLAAVQPFAH